MYKERTWRVNYGPGQSSIPLNFKNRWYLLNFVRENYRFLWNLNNHRFLRILHDYRVLWILKRQSISLKFKRSSISLKFKRSFKTIIDFSEIQFFYVETKSVLLIKTKQWKEKHLEWRKLANWLNLPLIVCCIDLKYLPKQSKYWIAVVVRILTSTWNMALL